MTGYFYVADTTLYKGLNATGNAKRKRFLYLTNKYLHCTLGVGVSLFYKNCGNLLTFLDYMHSMHSQKVQLQTTCMLKRCRVSQLITKLETIYIKLLNIENLWKDVRTEKLKNLHSYLAITLLEAFINLTVATETILKLEKNSAFCLFK